MHVPVMPTEVLDLLAPAPGKVFVDGTFGRGGHTRSFLDLGAVVYAFDMDPDAIAHARAQFAIDIANRQLMIVPANFARLDESLCEQGLVPPCLDGAFFDLGMSSNQIEESRRGFSFLRDEPLDMRMSPELGVTAADLVNALPEKHLTQLLWDYAQESQASRIAHHIVAARVVRPFQSTKQLAALVEKAKGGRRDGHLHPATKTFQALRIAVNMEMDNLSLLLDQVLDWMLPGGRVGFLSFHEGEDRQVKHRFQDWEKLGRGMLVTKKPVMPSDEEVAKNVRSRSARLRVMEVL